MFKNKTFVVLSGLQYFKKYNLTIFSFSVVLKGFFSSSSLLLNNYSIFPKIKVKEELSKLAGVNFNIVNKTVDTLSKVQDLKIKFGEYEMWPQFSISDLDYFDANNMDDWKDYLKDLIKYTFEEGSTYSVAVMGAYKDTIIEKISFVTFGPHLLLTNEIDIKNLITYIEGQIDSCTTNIVSGCDSITEGTKSIIYFKYREITKSKDVYKAASKINYVNKLKITNVDTKDTKFLEKIDNNKNLIKFLNIIPLSCNLKDYGTLLKKSEGYDENYTHSYKYFFKYNDEIDIDLYNYIEDVGCSGIIYKNDSEYLRFQDIILNNIEYDFIRIIGNNYFYIKNNKLSFIETNIKSRSIKIEKRAIVQDKNIITFDIECYLEIDLDKNSNNEDIGFKFIPYGCAWYSEKEYKLYVSTEFNSWEDMIKQFLTDIEKRYNKHTVYIHNLSNFDSIYILKSLYKYFKTTTLFKDGKSISIKITNKEKSKTNKLNIKFKDSLLLLPLSLEKLIESFSIEIKKLLFPYFFIKKDNLNYEGDLPGYYEFFKYFNDNNFKDYLELSVKYKNNKWNLLNETKKYMYNDVKSLYETLKSFSKDVYDIERKNITDVVSISSLALNTFLTNYYDESKNSIYIPRIKQYYEIKAGYFGGRVEVFKLYGEDVYVYDVVSMYPFVMLLDMPVDWMRKSTDPNLNNYFGFCYATVDVPVTIYNPILPFRDEFGNVYNPVGSWTAMFSSEILKLAKEIDNVKIKIHYGYKFRRGKDLFKKYVNFYFKLKKDSKNNAGKKFLAKLLLNSLYGRLGLKYLESKSKFVTSTQAKEISLKYQVLDNYIIDEENDFEFIKYTLNPSDILKDINFKSYIELCSKESSNEDFINRSVPISAMITSYAACFMHKFLNLPDNDCYYTDTDSLVLKYPLDPKYIGDNLGQFKFVGKYKKAYFISPKLYCLITEDGETIMKTKGLNSLEFNEIDFINMYNGVKINKNNIYRFKTDLEKLTVYYQKLNFNVSSQILKRMPIYKNNLIIDTIPLYVKDGNLLKLNNKMVLFNANKYALILSNKKKLKKKS